MNVPVYLMTWLASRKSVNLVESELEELKARQAGAKLKTHAEWVLESAKLNIGAGDWCAPSEVIYADYEIARRSG